MADKHRQQRRTKRLAKQKKRRSNASRPARDGGGAAPPSFKTGLTWPPGECYLTSGWDAPGAKVSAVFARSHNDGRTVAAIVQLDRSGPGITHTRVIALPAAEMVLAECIEMSEAADDIQFQGAPPSIVAGVLIDAEENGSRPSDPWPRARSLLEGVDPDPLDTPWGPAQEVADKPGMLERLFRYLG